MCNSKKNGGRRCVGHYQQSVTAKENQLSTANAKIKEQTRLVRRLNKESVEEIKQLKLVARTTKVKREKERALTRINKITDTLFKEKVKLNEYRNISGNRAEELEDRYQTMALLKGEDTIKDYTGTKLGNAIVVEKYGEDSEEWHQQRTRGYGGSDIGAILRIKDAKSSYNDVFNLKTGLKKQTLGSAGAAKLGHQFEPIIRRQFAEKHPEMTVYNVKSSWTHKTRDYQLANVDGLIDTTGDGVPDAILEIKTSNEPWKWRDENGNDKLPEYYRKQVLWYMSVFGIKKGHLAVLIDNNTYKEFEITANPGELGNIHKKVQEFRDNVAAYNKTA